ncbi:hypothetical protein [Cognaticolwellia mytili]|uniref:hypothetical protein n=1 Tax=Cognaticolwellia mytili TaxID=1888913 RepID=UPI000A1776A0|nr:hypothetical protein [Cognaticolwellia mytili]
MGDNEFIETLRHMKVDESEIKEIIAQQQRDNEQHDEALEIQPGNALIVHLFFIVAKYWERVGMEATPLYLDPVKVEARASKLAWYKQLDDEALELLWNGLDIMEMACSKVWSTQREEKTHE